MRLIVVFLFLQLGLWLFVGRKSLIRLAPEMIADDVRSVALLNERFQLEAGYPERIYIISDRLAQAIGDDLLDGLALSLSRFNGTVLSEDDVTYFERTTTDGCGDCLFVGIRQTVNTPFVAKSYTSYTRPLMFTQMHGIQHRTREREHVYVWILGRWVPLRTAWV
jgi:hypothetical protein